MNMTSIGGLNSHLTCLVYLPYIPKDHENHEFSLKLHISQCYKLNVKQ